MSENVHDARFEALLRDMARGPDMSIVGLPRREDSLVGDQVGPYRVESRLGRGGMGVVYQARDVQLGRKVALKLIRAEALGDERAQKRFLREARMTARFSHPHIVNVYGYGQHEGHPYLALEYLGGDTLRQRISAEPLGPGEVLRAARDIADALAEAHHHRVLHRDLKPENVLLASDGRLRVLDFGLAKPLARPARTEPPPAGEPTADRSTDTSSPAADVSTLGSRGAAGTPAYMAPEQWDPEAEVGAASDVWALGVVLFELATGQLPWRGTTTDELRREICEGDPPAMTLVRGNLRELVQDCLSRTPGARPTASQLRDRLELLLPGGRPRVAGDDSPFRGLLPFDERHADQFFGRQHEVAAFGERLRDTPVLPVVGPSGAGKSSFVQAGVIPRLREQSAWRVITLRPGVQPFETLAARLLDEAASASSVDPSWGPDRSTDSEPEIEPVPTADLESSIEVRGEKVEELSHSLSDSPGRLGVWLRQLAEAEGRRVLLLVDQLEELYTLVPDRLQRQQFIEALCRAADDERGPVRVVLTVRDDFLTRLAETSVARSVLGQVFMLGSPDAEAFTEILQRSVQRAGYAYDDPQLVQDMVQVLASTQAGLPLLQATGQLLWENRDADQRLLRRSAYEEIGGVAGALATHADRVLQVLSADRQRIARELLVRLVTPEGTRRVVSRTALVDGLVPEAGEVLEYLVTARTLLLRKGEQTEDDAELELVHESLVTHWQRLSQWLVDSREERAFLAELEEAARLWNKRGRPAEEVWTGPALQEALLRARRVQHLPDLLRAFLSAGAHRVERQTRRKRVGWGMLMAGLIALAVGGVAFAVVVNRKSQEVRRERDRARQAHHRTVKKQAEALYEAARAAYVGENMQEARAKLRLSIEKRDSIAARALWWRLCRSPLLWRQRFPDDAPLRVAFAPDGKSVAMATLGHGVIALDVQTQTRRAVRGAIAQQWAVAYSPDSKQLAMGSAGGLTLWDLDRKQGRPFKGHKAAVNDLSFDPQGRRVATVSRDRTLRIWEVATGKTLRVIRGDATQMLAVGFSRDGRWLAAVDGRGALRLWNAQSGVLRWKVSAHRGPATALAFLANGRQIATAGSDRTVRIWSLADGGAVRSLRGHALKINRIAAHPTAPHVLATASSDKTIRVWDTKRGLVTYTLRGHTASVSDVVFGPQGRRLASVSMDQSIRLWRLSAAVEPEDTDRNSAVVSAAFSPSGRKLAAAGDDQIIRIWDVAKGTVDRTLRGHEDGLFGIAYSPDGTLLATTSRDRTVGLWDARTGALLTRLRGHESTLFNVHFNPAGTLLATASADRTVRIWAVPAGKLVHVIRAHGAIVLSGAFSPNGKQLATASADGTIRLWSVPGWRPLRVLKGHGGRILAAQFSPDGKRLLSGGGAGKLLLWDTKDWTHRQVGRVPGFVFTVAWAPDSRHAGIAYVGPGPWPRVIDTQTGEFKVWAGHPDAVSHLTYSPDGRLLASCGGDGLRLWDGRTRQPRWFSRLLLPDPPTVVTHRGWRRLDRDRGWQKPAAKVAWQATVQDRSRWAEPSTAGTMLCVVTTDNHLELWDRAQDKRLNRAAVSHISRILALPVGCVALSKGTALWLGSTGGLRRLAKGATALGRWQGEGDILVAAGGKVLRFSATGQPRAAYPGGTGVSALARIPVQTPASGPSAAALVLGYKDGAVELRGLSPRSISPRSLKELPSSPVVRIAPGPKGILALSFRNGLVGLWSLENSARLVALRLHSPMRHMRIHRGRLVVTSELGESRAIDLSIYTQSYCSLLREIWTLPVVWESGFLVRRPPPKDHRCSRR